MKKKTWLIIVICLAAIGVYLWWAHFYIYYKLGAVGLKSPRPGTNQVMDNKLANKNLVYVALGDSLTSGVGVTNAQEAWPAIVAEKLTTDQRQINLKNLSFPGFRTSDLIAQLLPQAIDIQPDFVTLLIGANDLHGQVGEEVFKKNYQTILEILTQKTKAKIYVISIPFIGSPKLVLPPYSTYFKNQTIKYNKIIKDLAVDYGAEYIDIYTPTVKVFQTDGPHYSLDFFHPSAEGYGLWAQIIYDHLNR